MGSTLVAIHDAWALALPRRRRSWWYAFVSPRRHHPFVDVVGCCPSRTAVRRAFVSVKLFGVAALRLELGDVEGAGRRTSVRGRCRGCRLSWVHASSRGRVWFSWALVIVLGCCVLHVSLLPLLCSHGILLGRCCRSWTAGVVSPSGLHVALHGVDVVAKRTWIVVGQCVEVVGDVVGVVVVG